LEQLDEARALTPPTGAQVTAHTPLDLLMRAHRAIDDGAIASALPVLEALCVAEPGWASPHISLGIAYLRVARVDEAADMLRRAEELVPGSFASEVAWGEYHARLGRYDRALAHLNRALETDPPTLVAYTAAVELRRVCRDRSKRLYYREATLPRFLSRFARRGRPATLSTSEH
jgi:tetratricopeptide (TPR) repeat protein